MACMLAGCANDGSLSTGLNTGSVNPATAQAAKSQEALCLTLASQIEALNTEGVSDKVSKAAAKKYKLKAADLTKADELNKANTEFQGKCSSYPPRVAATAPIEPVTKDTAAAAKETPKVAAAKVKPAVPAQKPVASAMATQEATQDSSGPVAVGAPQ
jgi:hypothetical protein